MKKYLFLLIISLLFSVKCFSQYRINKTKYDTQNYSFQTGDPYNPVTAGFASIIPGLGQIIVGEPGRGFLFFGGFSLCLVATSIGMIRFIETIGSGISGEDPPPGGPFLMTAGSVGMVVIDIWSILDAAHVAKINNLAFRDQGGTTYYFQIQPSLKTTCCQMTGSISAGIALKITF